MNLNKVFFAGNLTRDPELRYTGGGSAVCNITVASNRRYTSKDGEKKEKSTFMRCTIWGKQGETVAQYFTKGKPIYIEGRLETRSWETDKGEKRSTVDIVVDNFQFIGGKGNGKAQSNDGAPF